MNQNERVNLEAFQGPEHLPFRLEGEQAIAVLLIHGFPGTPAEMRPLAELVHKLGATVVAPLLPGFGHQISTLSGRSRHEWIETVSAGLRALRQTHRRVILAGFSMGGALSIIAARESVPPDHLILLAPFWQLGQRWHQPLWPLVKLLLREFKPFAKADLADPVVRRDLGRSMPTADLSDPAVQQAIRQISFPISVIDEIVCTGRAAWQAAPSLDIPLTIVQGIDDQIVSSAATRRLATRFPRAAALHEVKAGHQLIDPTLPTWPSITSRIADCLLLCNEI